MGYVLRVRLASFFTGAALASGAGLYFLQKDYKVAHHAISQQIEDSKTTYKQLREKIKYFCFGRRHPIGTYDWTVIFFSSIYMNGLYESLDERVLALEKLKEVEAPKHVEASE